MSHKQTYKLTQFPRIRFWNIKDYWHCTIHFTNMTSQEYIFNLCKILNYRKYDKI